MMNERSSLSSQASNPEPGLGNGTFSVLAAKVLGGGSVINGMVYDRGSAVDYDAWGALGNKGWGWSGMEPYFKKGTTFQPPSEKIAEDFNITWDPNTYGKGPLTVSITDNQYADIKDYWAAWKATSVHVPVDGNNGEAYGRSRYANTIDKTTGRRAHARYAYIDPITMRNNLKILTKTTAQRIIFDDKKKPTMARGVEITDDATGKTSIVHAKKEVVLAAGAIQTPKLLQLSGIGPNSVLKASGVNVRVELDAVGSNFQDHPYATVVFNTTTNTFPNQNSLANNATFNATAWAEYVANKTGPYTYARGNALAFISLPAMTNDTNAIVSSLNSQKAETYLPAVYKSNKKLLKGFAQAAFKAPEHFNTKLQPQLRALFCKHGIIRKKQEQCISVAEPSSDCVAARSLDSRYHAQFRSQLMPNQDHGDEHHQYVRHLGTDPSLNKGA
jgi:choline dehydrogenase-like flavoprotein